MTTRRRWLWGIGAAIFVVIGVVNLLAWRELRPGWRRRPRPETSLRPVRTLVMPGHDPRHHYAGDEGFDADEENVYWLSTPAGLSAQSHIEVFTRPLAGGAPRLLGAVDHPHSTTLGSLVATSDALYFAAGEFSSSRGRSSMYRVPKTGGVVARVYEFREGFGAATLVATSEAIYWHESNLRREKGDDKMAVVDELHALPLIGGEPRIAAVLPPHTGQYALSARGTALGVKAQSGEVGTAHVFVFFLERLGAPLRQIFDTTERSEATFVLGERHAFLTLGHPLETSGPAPLLAVPIDGGKAQRFATLVKLSPIAVIGDEPVVADDEYPEDHPGWMDSGSRSLLLRRFDARGSSTRLLRTDGLYVSPVFERGGLLYFWQTGAGGAPTLLRAMAWR